MAVRIFFSLIRDRAAWLEVLGQTCERFNWVCHAWCQMTNHYHLLIETPEANLAQGMRQLNGVYTQRFNRAHQRIGHVFQGRYKAILVERDNYLLELARYVCIKPAAGKHGKGPRRLAMEQLPCDLRTGARANLVANRLDTGAIRATASQRNRKIYTVPSMRERACRACGHNCRDRYT